MEIPKFGFSTNPVVDVVKGINKLGKYGFDFVEISFQEPLALPNIMKKRKLEIKKTLKNHNLELLAHSPWWNDFGSLHEHVRKGWITETKELLDVGNELGMVKMNIHPNFFSHNSKDEKSKQTSIDNNSRSLQEIVDYASSYDITIVVENNVTTWSPVKFNELKEIINGIEKIKVTVDIGHAFIEGGMELILKYIQTFKNKLGHMHFHDNHGNNDEHLPLGVALIDYNKVVQELKKLGYKETITLEVFEPDIIFSKDSMERLRRLWGSEKR